MPKIPLPSLANLLHAFFHDWLAEQRNASHRTVLAYRDAWRLFLRFAAKHQQRSVTSLGLEHLSATAILAFLQDLEKEGKASIRTRNCRLAALRSFFSFVAAHEPLAAQQCAEVRGHSIQASASAGCLLSGIRGSLHDPGPTQSNHFGGTKRLCLAVASLQHRRTH